MGEFAVFELVASEPAEGTNVVVDRTRNGLTERTVRTLRRRPNGTLVLETPTSIKSLFSELCYPSTNADDSLTIVGVVIGKYVDFEG